MLSQSFQRVKIRGVTNTSGDVIGISFDCPDGTIIRVALDMSDAAFMADGVAEYIAPYRVRMSSHSESSSGNPNCDGSPHDGQ